MRPSKSLLLSLALGAMVVLALVTSCVVPQGPALVAPASPLPAIAEVLSPTVPAPPREQQAPVPDKGHGLSPDALATLSSLAQVDDHPLYTMRYHGSYANGPVASRPQPAWAQRSQPASWACSLFAAPGEREHAVYGRNFDWYASPALLLFTSPPGAYASVSMVDISYLGFDGDQALSLMELPLEDQQALLDAPYLPFDGMNEHGLAVGMAAVPASGTPQDPAKETIGSLGVIRQMLDHARDVGEALDILQGYNVSMRGGPAVHYLIADATGRAILVEFYGDGLAVMENQQPWHTATNFLLGRQEDSPAGRCWRYDRIWERLAASQGRLTIDEAMELLAEVSQPNTQWSVVYAMSDLDVRVVMGRKYDKLHVFQLIP